MSGAAYPCKQCELSARNSVHVRKDQFGYHEYEAPDETEDETKTHKITIEFNSGRDISCSCGWYAFSDTGADDVQAKIDKHILNTVCVELGLKFLVPKE